MKLIRLLFLTFLTTLALSPIAAADTAASSSLCDLSVEALKRASAVRGLALKNAVPCVVQDQAAVTNFIQTTIKENLPAQKLEMEEFAYKAIGLIPHSFDYQNKMVEFLVGQIGGYYDPKKKRFVMAGWLPASVQSSVAEHELTHALQDQYYDLGSIVNSKKATSDSGMAASALIEGDASAVMYDCQKAVSGLAPLKDERNIDALLLMQVLGIGFDGEVPESLKALLVFPYSSGLRFAHALLREGGYRRIDEAYKRVPTTSREILHPEDYLSGSFVPKIPDDSELTSSASGASLEYTDVLGEFGISSLFRGAAITKDRGALAAKGWVGDKLGVFKSAGGLRSIVWLTRWESEEDAKEFANLYREYAKVINLSSDKDADGVGAVSVTQVGSEVLVRPKI
jgi:hypothetical protein